MSYRRHDIKLINITLGATFRSVYNTVCTKFRIPSSDDTIVSALRL